MLVRECYVLSSPFGSSHVYLVKALKRPAINKSTLFNPAFPNHGMPSNSPTTIMPIKFLLPQMGDQGCLKALRREDEGVGRREKMENAADCVLAEPDREEMGQEVRYRGWGRKKSVQGSMSLALPHRDHHLLWILGKCREESQPAAGTLPGISGRRLGRFWPPSWELCSGSRLVIFQLCNFEHAIWIPWTSLSSVLKIKLD